MGWYLLVNYVKISCSFDKFVIGSTTPVKSGQLGGNADTFMLIFSADTLDFLITDIFLEEGIINFFSNLITEADLAINFDLAKCITKINIPKL